MDKKQNNSQVVYGLRPVIEAIESGRQIDKVLMQNGLSGDLANVLKTKIRQAGVPFQYVPTEKLNRMAEGNHQGVVALIAAIGYYSFIDLIPNMIEEGKSPLVVLLDHITDVRNMGAIARTAECAGVDALIVPDHGSAAINQNAIKTSSGALLRLPICRESNMKTVVNLAKQCGMQVVASTEKGSVYYREVDFSLPTMLIMGNEEHGISHELLKMSDIMAYLPVVGDVSSLNVSVAAGVMMYEALGQRRRVN